jgi:hypothetical protein
MGADEFFTMSEAGTAKEAFQKAVDEARLEYGRGGYTGTIAEKSSFKMVNVPEGVPPVEYAQGMLSDYSNKEVQDKWGPALCVKVNTGQYLFFGVASS